MHESICYYVGPFVSPESELLPLPTTGAVVYTALLTLHSASDEVGRNIEDE